MGALTGGGPPVPLVVVGAALLDGRRLLAARRVGPPALAGGWELPGGKVDPGEDERDALARECREELGVEVELLDRVGGDWPLGAPGHVAPLRPDAVLRVWTARIRVGAPVAGPDHSELRWLEPGRWYDVPWLPADLPVVRALEILTHRREE